MIRANQGERKVLNELLEQLSNDVELQMDENWEDRFTFDKNGYVKSLAKIWEKCGRYGNDEQIFPHEVIMKFAKHLCNLGYYVWRCDSSGSTYYYVTAFKSSPVSYCCLIECNR